MPRSHGTRIKDGPGFLALTGYDEVLAVSRDSVTWSSQVAGVFFDIPRPEDAYQFELMMLTMDPPRHTKLRSLVSKGFTPRQVAKLNRHVADMAREIVDDVVERGECDFVNDIAGALPSFVIAELLGIPLEDGRRLYELTEIMNTGSVGDVHSVQAQLQMFEYGTELAAKKRAAPGDDIATSLLQAELDGERLTDLEFNMFFLLLINAGGDTTRNLVASGILAMMEHPGEQARLAEDPSLLPTAIEEMLRYTSPVTVFVRTATTDTELGGIPVKAGDRAAMFYPSANRDDTRFAESGPLRHRPHAESTPRLRRRRDPFLPWRQPCPRRGHCDHSRGAVPDEGPRARRTGRASAVEPDERHPLDARQVHRCLLSRPDRLRQRKLLTYLPISNAMARLTADGWPAPKSGVNSWYGPIAAAINA